MRPLDNVAVGIKERAAREDAGFFLVVSNSILINRDVNRVADNLHVRELLLGVGGDVARVGADDDWSLGDD